MKNFPNIERLQRRLQRIRRVGGAVGLATAVLLAIASDNTNSVGFRYQGAEFSVTFVVCAMIVRAAPGVPRGWSTIDHVSAHYNGLEYWQYRRYGDGFAIPLYYIYGGFFFAGVACFVPDVRLLLRRSYPPGSCGKCGYDLTGNVSGVCPECGAKCGTIRS